MTRGVSKILYRDKTDDANVYAITIEQEDGEGNLRRVPLANLQGVKNANDFAEATKAVLRKLSADHDAALQRAMRDLGKIVRYSGAAPLDGSAMPFSLSMITERNIVTRPLTFGEAVAPSIEGTHDEDHETAAEETVVPATRTNKGRHKQAA